jgi:hypothetical protein
MGEYNLTNDQKQFIPYKENDNLIFKCDSTNEILQYNVTNVKDTFSRSTNATEEEISYNDYQYSICEYKVISIKNINDDYDFYIDINSANFDANPNFSVLVYAFSLNKPCGSPKITGFSQFSFDTIPLTSGDTSKYHYSYIKNFTINNRTFNDVFTTKGKKTVGCIDSTATYVKELYLNKNEGIICFVLTNNKKYFLNN